MLTRHSLLVALFLGVAASLSLIGAGAMASEPPPDDATLVAPPEALAALREGRYLRASLILREYLTARADTTIPVILLAARAEAGWGDWQRVRELLEGRSWLDRVAHGHGWDLLGRSQIALGAWQEGSASLGRFLAMADESQSDEERGIAQLRRARALAEQRDAAGALVAYDQGAELLPHIGDWIQVFAASAAAGVGDTAEVRRRLERAGSDLAEWAWRTPVRARRVAGDVDGAIALAEAAAARLDTPARRAAAWTLIGQIRQQRGDVNRARAAYIRAINSADASPAAVDAARALSAMPGLSPEDQLLIGRVYLRHGNSTRGVAGLTAYLDSDRGTPAQRERLLYDIANAHFRAGDYVQAQRELLAVAGSVSDAAVAADALHTAARAQYRHAGAEAARPTLRRVVRDYPQQPAAVAAAWLLADLYHDDDDLANALHHYRTVIHLAPAGSEAAAARMRIGGIAFAAGRYDDALREFEEFRASHTTGRAYQQATFWAGMASARSGRADDARRFFEEVRRTDPFSYYGGVAAEQLGDDIWHLRLEHAPPQHGRYDAAVRGALARVDLLRAIGWEEAATFETERVRRHFARFDGALYVLAEEINARGFINTGVALGWDIYRREGAWNLRLLRIVYPFPFQNIIVAEAHERSVDPFLAAALIRQESMFNPSARSHAGALGLMQVMPPTGSAVARRLAIPRFSADLLLRPEVNVTIGTTYLAEQLSTYGQRLDVVLAAYNAGPGRVTRWRRFPEFRDPLLFAERIPFDETRDYVRIVQNNRRLYTVLYGSPVP